jgi:hypothetical protein
MVTPAHGRCSHPLTVASRACSHPAGEPRDRADRAVRTQPGARPDFQKWLEQTARGRFATSLAAPWNPRVDTRQPALVTQCSHRSPVASDPYLSRIPSACSSRAVLTSGASTDQILLGKPLGLRPVGHLPTAAQDAGAVLLGRSSRAVACTHRTTSRQADPRHCRSSRNLRHAEEHLPGLASGSARVAALAWIATKESLTALVCTYVGDRMIRSCTGRFTLPRARSSSMGRSSLATATCSPFSAAPPLRQRGRRADGHLAASQTACLPPALPPRRLSVIDAAENAPEEPVVLRRVVKCGN